MKAPFAPLVANGEELAKAPIASDDLCARLADVFGVPRECVLVAPGRAAALDVVCRSLALEGAGVAGDACAVWTQAAAASRLRVEAQPGLETVALYKASPGERDEPVLDEPGVSDLLALWPKTLVLADETFIAFSEARSLALVAAQRERLIVLRDLGVEYGLMGAPCAVLVAHAPLIARWRNVASLYPLATPVSRLALSALDPHKAAPYEQRRRDIKEERRRLALALANSTQIAAASPGEGPFVFITPRDRDAANRAVRQWAVAGTWLQDGRFRIDVRDPVSNDAALAAFGVGGAPRGRRCGEAVRETAETKIVARVDLDRAEPRIIETGVAFFDHMLAQIATHAGFALHLKCTGDTEVDAHHTIEDCALALGQALAQALGDRRGVARFGFLLPMDEAEAKVSIDLGGRPYLVFEGSFTAPMLGEYPTEMTEHVFGSLSQTLGAAIHLAVTGANDHHKTEACYKAFGRALRQAIRIESEELPSTKGTLT